MKQQKSKLSDKRFWLDLILPNRCAVCGKIIVWDKYCCDECYERIPFIDIPVCSKCGKAECICYKNLNYDMCFTVAWYDKFMQKPVVRFKTESPVNFSALFAEKLADLIKSAGEMRIDIVTAVPMSKKSLVKRGYNQAYELAKCLAKELSLPASDKILTKQETDFLQHELSSEQRREKIKGVFGFDPKADVKGKTVLLCDDIITTGSTFDECASVLKQNGASCVICAAAANTKFQKKNYNEPVTGKMKAD